MHKKNIYTAGKDLQQAQKVLIMLHGRGASAQDILGLASHLNVTDYAMIAPQATNHTWYPYSFIVKPEQNEPWLGSALNILKELVDDVEIYGIPPENIYFLGFSQGACLTLEYVCRNAKKYGGIVAFTGGLIGEKINQENYKGNFNGTPILISTGNPDPHVPIERVKESYSILKEMNANVDLKIFEAKPHSISTEEIELANQYIFL